MSLALNAAIRLTLKLDKLGHNTSPLLEGKLTKEILQDYLKTCHLTSVQHHATLTFPTLKLYQLFSLVNNKILTDAKVINERGLRYSDHYFKVDYFDYHYINFDSDNYKLLPTLTDALLDANHWMGEMGILIDRYVVSTGIITFYSDNQKIFKVEKLPFSFAAPDQTGQAENALKNLTLYDFKKVLKNLKGLAGFERLKSEFYAEEEIKHEKNELLYPTIKTLSYLVKDFLKNKFKLDITLNQAQECTAEMLIGKSWQHLHAKFMQTNGVVGITPYQLWIKEFCSKEPKVQVYKNLAEAMSALAKYHQDHKFIKPSLTFRDSMGFGIWSLNPKNLGDIAEIQLKKNYEGPHYINPNYKETSFSRTKDNRAIIDGIFGIKDELEIRLARRDLKLKVEKAFNFKGFRFGFFDEKYLRTEFLPDNDIYIDETKQVGKFVRRNTRYLEQKYTAFVKKEGVWLIMNTIFTKSGVTSSGNLERFIEFRLDGFTDEDISSLEKTTGINVKDYDELCNILLSKRSRSLENVI